MWEEKPTQTWGTERKPLFGFAVRSVGSKRKHRRRAHHSVTRLTTCCRLRQENLAMLRPGTFMCRHPASYSLSWAWAAASPSAAPTVCSSSTPWTTARTGISSPKSVSLQPSAACTTRKAQFTPRKDSRAGDGSRSTFHLPPSEACPLTAC